MKILSMREQDNSELVILRSIVFEYSFKYKKG